MNEQPSLTEQRQKAQGIINQIVDKYQSQAADAPNPLRLIEACAAEIYRTLQEKGLLRFAPVGAIYECDSEHNEEFLKPPIKAVIGDIDPRSFGFIITNERDLLEREYSTLADEMLLVPGTKRREQMDEEKKTLEELDYGNRASPAPNQYDTTARGLPGSRNIIAQEAQSLGMNDISQENVWMGHGGMEILIRAYRALANYLKQNGKEKPTMVVSSPCFKMARNAASDNGLTIIDIDASDLPRQELTAERLKQAIGDQIPDIILITPADNPTARSLDPENLRQVITEFLNINPNGYFIFDMAYISMIHQEKAQEIIRVIKETGAYQRAIFAFSESKKYAIPGYRVGAAVIPDREIGIIFQTDTSRNSPGFSRLNDYDFQARAKLITPETLEKYLRLLRQRQQTLLETLRALDPNQELFEGLDKIAIPGYEDQSPNAEIIQDVPLYLWVKLKPGVTAWDLIKKLGIIGVPGEVFGDTQGYMRFSLGVVSTSDILGLLPKS